VLHYEMIQNATTVKPEDKPTRTFDFKRFKQMFGVWLYALLISLLPSFIIFLLFTGPPQNFAFLELFHDQALFYVCVSMSAVSLFMSGKINWLAGVHSIIMLFAMAMYIFAVSGQPIPLFDEYYFDRRVFIAWLLLISNGVGILTIIYSASNRREK